MARNKPDIKADIKAAKDRDENVSADGAAADQ